MSVTYAWLKAGAGKRQREDQVLLAAIRAAFDGSGRTYGAGRIVYELRGDGIRAGKKRIWRLMKQHGLRVKTARRFKVTTNSAHKHPLAPNLVQRCFSAEAPDRLWTGDITYILTAEGWLYLAVVLDVFSRRIVGWSMDKRMTDEHRLQERNAQTAARTWLDLSLGSRGAVLQQTVPILSERNRRASEHERHGLLL